MSHAILASAALAAFGLLAPAAFAGVDPALLALVMPDARMLIGIQVKQTQASPFGQYLLSQGLLGQVQMDRNASKVMTAAGFDPRRDLREILAVSGDGSTGLLLLGRGSFQPARISTAAVRAGAVSSIYRGVALLTLTEVARTTEPGSAKLLRVPNGLEGRAGPARGSNGNGKNQAAGSLAFLDASTVAAGNTDAVKAAIDRRAAGAVFSGPLADRARQIGSANDAWVATLTPATLMPAAALAGAVRSAPFGPFENVLQSALQLSAGLKFAATQVTLSGEVLARTAQDAQAMADILRFVAGMIQSGSAQANRSQDPNAPKAAALAGRAQISSSGATMHLVISVPEQQVEQLFAPAATRRERQR